MGGCREDLETPAGEDKSHQLNCPEELSCSRA